MTMYHAVMTDECGGEFGADVEASSRSEAYEKLREDYPESRVAQLESPEDTQAREERLYAKLWDDDRDHYDDYDDY